MAECERGGVSFLSGKGRGREKMSIFGMVFLMLPVMEKVFNLREELGRWFYCNYKE